MDRHIKTYDNNEIGDSDADGGNGQGDCKTDDDVDADN